MELSDLQKGSRKIRLESNWIKSLFSESFRTEYFKRKFDFYRFKAILDTSFRPSQSFFGKWNYQVICDVIARAWGKTF